MVHVPASDSRRRRDEKAKRCNGVFIRVRSYPDSVSIVSLPVSMCPLISLLPVSVSSLPVAASSGPPLASAALLAVPLRLLSARRNKAGEYGKHGQRPSDNDERA